MSENPFKGISLRDLDIELARKSFWEYCKLTSPDFYKESRPHLKKICDTLNDFHHNDLLDKNGDPFSKLMIRFPPQFGKAIEDNVPVLTTSGWKRHGDLEIGDYVYGADGKQKKILNTQESYEYDCAKVTLDTKEEIICSVNHLWKTENMRDKRRNEKIRYIRDTEIVETKDIFNGYHAKSPAIKVCKSLENEQKRLLIDPYYLGCWLGDGNYKEGAFTCHKDDFYIYDGYVDRVIEKANKPTTYKVTKKGLTKKLRYLRLYGNKRIPSLYLTSSIAQRLELLKGLMDTDGTVSSNGCNASYTSIKKDFAYDVFTLVRSLGYKCTIFEYDAKLYGRFISKQYRITFTPTITDELFKLKRKQDRVNNKEKPGRNDRFLYFIKSVENCGRHFVKCITVEDGMYLIGRGLIPTHNSRTLTKYTQWALGLNNEERIITASYGESTAVDFSKYTRDGIMEIKNTKDQIVFSDIFPKTTIKKTDASAQRWALTGQHFNYLGVGCGGAVTGKGATIRIIDDLIKDAEQAMSENALEKAWLWFSGTFSSRSSAIGGEVKEIFCATLWGEGDPQMILEETEGDEWFVLALPIYDAKTDKMLCDDFMNKKAFEKLKKRMLIDSRSRMIFYANYMCEAIDDNETKAFPRSSIKTYRELPMETINEDGIDRKELAGWCAAFADTADEGTDNFAMPICQIVGKYVYLKDCIFDQENLTYQETAVRIKCKEHKVNDLTVETNHAGHYFRRSIAALLIKFNIPTEVFGQWSKANKMSRILSMAGLIKLYFLFPENPNADTQRFMNQVYKLKKTSKKEDDAPDALAGLCSRLESFFQLFV